MTVNKAIKEFREWLKDLTANNANVFQVISAHKNKDSHIEDFINAEFYEEQQAKCEAEFEGSMAEYWDAVENGMA